MSSVGDSQPKIEKKQILALSIGAYSFLYISTVAMFYLCWLSVGADNVALTATYILFYSIFLVAHFLVVRDIYSNYEFFLQEKNDAGIEFLARTHFLCANPFCHRCRGWYFGLGTSFAVIAILLGLVKTLPPNNTFLDYVFITIGIIVFAAATPVHGALNFLVKLDKRILGSDKLKLFFGFASGLSLVLVALGIIGLIS